MPPSPTAQHHCATCHKVFSRLEHLQRHRKTHSGSRPFSCRYCSVAFSRKDAASRHEHTRHESSDHGERRPAMRRACLACSAARVACSGGTPCTNCRAKERPCVYVRRQRRRMSWEANDGAAAPADGHLEHSALSTDTASADTGSETSFEPGEGSHRRRKSSAISVNSSYGNGAFITQSSIGEGPKTPLNWLPFDLSTSDRHSDVQHWNEDAQPVRAELRQVTSAPNDFLTDGPASRQNGQASTPQLDSLNSLIASMGRASRAFGNSHPVRLNSTTDIDAKPLRSLYSDGAGARISQAERALQWQRAQGEKTSLTLRTDNPSPPDSGGAWLKTLEAAMRSEPQPDGARLYQIPANIYGDIMAKVDVRIPFRSSGSAFGLDSSNFPAKDTLEHFIGLYFERFQPVYPFLDLPLLNMPFWGWSLCLATASVGCYYSDLPSKDTCGDALSVILREMLVNELQFTRVECTLTYLQALLLNTLALCQSGNTSVMALGEEAISSVMNSCLRFCLLEEPDWEIERNIQFQGDVNQMWTAWRCREMRRRTGLFAWILDTSLAFTRTASPVLSLQSLNLMLPSKEKLWGADSAEAWYKAHRPHPKDALDSTVFAAEEEGRASFQTMFSELYERLELVENVSEFARVACIYALLHRHWDLVRHFQAPLSIPQNEYVYRASHELTTAAYPAAIPDFTRWRNKACDVMDVLHWEALGEAAKAGGWEAPYILKLHLGRLMLLTPVKELLTLAEELVSDSCFVQLPHNVAWQRTDLARCRQAVSTWAHADRYKARLAVMHAGATFWHVRRYGSDSFVQPFTVYIAAITLFYFARLSVAERTDPEIAANTSPTGTRSYEGNEDGHSLQLGHDDICSRSSDLHSPAGSSTLSAGSNLSQRQRTTRMPSYCYMDRPVDDEMVQHIVRNGVTSTRLCAEGIDDLCTAEGAKQILLEAAALLETGIVVWPIARKYATVLRSVAAEEGSITLV